MTLATGNTGSTPLGYTWAGASDRQLIILGIVVVVVGGQKMVVGGRAHAGSSDGVVVKATP